jgi:hypothetical protein
VSWPRGRRSSSQRGGPLLLVPCGSVGGHRRGARVRRPSRSVEPVAVDPRRRESHRAGLEGIRPAQSVRESLGAGAEDAGGRLLRRGSGDVDVAQRFAGGVDDAPPVPGGGGADDLWPAMALADGASGRWRFHTMRGTPDRLGVAPARWRGGSEVGSLAHRKRDTPRRRRRTSMGSRKSRQLRSYVNSFPLLDFGAPWVGHWRRWCPGRRVEPGSLGRRRGGSRAALRRLRRPRFRRPR